MFWINENDVILYRDVSNEVATRQRSSTYENIADTRSVCVHVGILVNRHKKSRNEEKALGIPYKIWALRIIQRFRYDRSFSGIKCRCKFFPSENLLYIRLDFSLQEKIYFTSEEMVDSSLCCIFSSYKKKFIIDFITRPYLLFLSNKNEIYFWKK